MLHAYDYTGNMANGKQADLIKKAKEVLHDNDLGLHTIPAKGLYPHQWLWDSCFTAIGIRHYDTLRAQQEILSLLRGQWHNGMLPNMILSNNQASRDKNIWRSWLNPNAPDDVETSGITQPPMIAEAVVKIGNKLKPAERRSWYRRVYKELLSYHSWLYDERDPHNEGLVLQLHPWETGLDDTPPWVEAILDHKLPIWINVIKALRLKKLINLFRPDMQHIPPQQRLDTNYALILYSMQRRLRRKNYDTSRAISHALVTMEDVTFNAIFIRANQRLKEIARTLGENLPDDLLDSMANTEEAFEQLWDPYSGQYYSREFVTHKLIKTSSIGTLIAIYSGVLTKDRVGELVKKLLENDRIFGATYPVPSAPINSKWFRPYGYWQGPTWINTNWLIIDGLKRAGFDDHAEALRESTIELVKKHGFWEYFNPLDGTPAGVEDFSWSAALTIDLISPD